VPDFVRALLDFRAKPAYPIHDNSYQQNHANHFPANGRPCQVETAAAEQKKKAESEEQ